MTEIGPFWREDFVCHYTLLKPTDVSYLGALGSSPATTGGQGLLQVTAVEADPAALSMTVLVRSGELLAAMQLNQCCHGGKYVW